MRAGLALPPKWWRVSNRAASRCTLRGASLLATSMLVAAGAAAADAAPETDPTARPVQEHLLKIGARQESAQKQPRSVATISGAQLTRTGALSMRDFVDAVPGLNATSTGNGGVRYDIRGIAAFSPANNDVAAVGYYLDETPISESANGADLVPFDLQRIEVLRGPQGTLFGEGSLGGAIRVVTNKPDATRYSGAVQASVSQTAHGGANQSASAMLNLPLIKGQLALRAVVSEYRNDGYLDNIVLHRDNVNTERKADGRLALRWTPDANITVDVSALLEYEREGGRNQDFALAGPLVENTEDLSDTFGLGREASGSIIANRAPPYSTVAQFPENFNSRRQVFSATVNDDLGWARFVSSTGYYRLSHNEYFDSRQDGQVIEGAVAALQGRLLPPGDFNLVQGVPSDVTSDALTVSQELRLTSPTEQRLRWVTGLFYSHRENSFSFQQSAPDLEQLLAGFPVDASHTFRAQQNVTFAQYALYGQATYDITARLHVMGGTRLFIEDVNGDGHTTILNTFSPSLPLLANLTFPADGAQHQRKAVFHASLSYDVAPDVQFYLLYSEGSRPGGLNQRLLTPYLPRVFGADTTRNYEAGVKTAFLDHRFIANAAVFQVDWSNPQIYVGLPPGGQNIYNLAAGARVRGAELDAIFAVTPDLQIGADYGWLCGETRGTLSYFDSLKAPTTGDFPGDLGLPNAPHTKINVFGEYGRDWGSTRTSLRVSDQYVGSSVPAFGIGYRLQPFNRLDAQMRVEHGNYALTLYATNLLDRVIEVASPSPLPGSFGIGIDQPRTIGLRLDGAF